MSQMEIVARLREGRGLPYAIEVEPAEVQQAVSDGVRNGHLKAEPSGMVQVSPERAATLQNVADESQALDERIRQKWGNELRERHGHITDTVLDEAWQGLAATISRVVTVLCRDGGTANSEHLPPEFAEGHPLHAIAEVEFPRFLVSEDVDYKAYLRRFLAHALYAYRTTVSREASDALRARMQGRALYLDTNVLLPALGLTGDEDFERGVRGILNLARGAGLKLLVTNRTVDEYEGALQSLRHRTVGNSVPESVWRRLTQSLDRAFLRESSTDFTTMAEFQARYADLRAVLFRQDINVCGIVEEAVSARESEAVRTEEFFQDARRAIQSSSDKEAMPLDHDAFHFALVAYRRRRDTWRDANGWFLTLDRGLARATRRMGWSVPLSMSPDEWVLAFRSILPRVDDFEDFVAAVVTRQIFPSFYIDQDRINLFAKLARGGAARAPNEVLSRLAETLPAQSIPRLSGDGNEIDSQELVTAIESMAERFQEQSKAVAAYGARQADERSSKLEADLAERNTAVAEAQKRAERAERVAKRAELKLQLRTLDDKIRYGKDSCQKHKQSIENIDRSGRAWTGGAVAIAALASGFAVYRRVPELDFWQALGVLGVLVPLVSLVWATVWFIIRWLNSGRRRRCEAELDSAAEDVRALRAERDAVAGALTEVPES